MKNRIIFAFFILSSAILIPQGIIKAQTTVELPPEIAAYDVLFEALCDSALVYDSTGSPQTKQYLDQKYDEYLTGKTAAGTPTGLGKISGAPLPGQMTSPRSQTQFGKVRVKLRFNEQEGHDGAQSL